MTTIFVDGIPAPQGSKRHVGNGVMVESSKKVKPWRAAVVAAAVAQNVCCYDEPVNVRIVFYLPRGATVKRELPSVRPDVDKLIRSTFDALSGFAWKDDAQVIHVDAVKVYATPPRDPGAYISVWPAESTLLRGTAA